MPSIKPPDLIAQEEVTFASWWSAARRCVEKKEQAKLDGVVAYTAWFLWRERNSRVFENNYSSYSAVASLVWSATMARALAFARVVDDDLV